MGDDDFLSELRAEVGRTGAPFTARDPVNLPTIRRWCDAMEDANPNYTDPERAETGPHGQVVAPPAMLNAWTMLPGNTPRVVGPDNPQGAVMTALEQAGYVGIVATNCEHVYHRYLHPGDVLTATSKLVDVSEEKQTGLGAGHFVTTETEYHDQHGEQVGSMFFRLLRFEPGSGQSAVADATDAGAPTLRPRPSRNQDTDFFWDGARVGELRIQRCAGCGKLQHPPGVRCPACGSSELDHVVVSGRGNLYSYATVHHPQVPAFDYPLVVGLVELEEGARLVSNVTDCTPEQVAVGMPLEAYFRDFGDGIVLPQFRPARPAAASETRRATDVAVGDALPLCPVPITATLVVTAALASGDHQPVHHDRDHAIRNGSRDIFMNILTSMGISGRYVSDWAGPDAVLRDLRIRLGAPNYPGDCMTLSGTVTRVDADGTVEVGFEGVNRLGAHLTGTAAVVLP